MYRRSSVFQDFHSLLVTTNWRKTFILQQTWWCQAFFRDQKIYGLFIIKEKVIYYPFFTLPNAREGGAINFSDLVVDHNASRSISHTVLYYTLDKNTTQILCGNNVIETLWLFLGNFCFLFCLFWKRELTRTRLFRSVNGSTFKSRRKNIFDFMNRCIDFGDKAIPNFWHIYVSFSCLINSL